MKPGTKVKHSSSFADFGIGVVLDPNSDEVAIFKRRVPHDLCQEWVYVKTPSGVIEGYPPSVLVPQTLEYELELALAEVTRIRQAILERDMPKADEVWTSGNFTATVKWVGEGHVFYARTENQSRRTDYPSGTIEGFMGNYEKS